MIAVQYDISWASMVAQTVKNLPASLETRVQPLSREDPLEEAMATHSSILARDIPWTEEPGGLQSMGSQRVQSHRQSLCKRDCSLFCTVCGIAKSRT